MMPVMQTMDRLAILLASPMDKDWTWWPFLHLRPNRNRTLPLWVWPALMIASYVAAVPVIAFVFTRSSVPPGASYIELTYIYAQSVAYVVVSKDLRTSWTIALFVAGFLYGGPLWAWNRRARRLARSPELSQQPNDPAFGEGTWPPPPEATPQDDKTTRRS
ncbi:MAG TPA: hypothetical protein VGK19_04320 [Capsulimonadaceae bacterium]|jgi:hypothetical protein